LEHRVTSAAGLDVRRSGDRIPAGLEPGGSRSFWVRVGVLALLGGAVPIAVAAHFGALGIPRNDDWSYVLSAFRFADMGTLKGNGAAGKNLVGQLVLSLPVVWLFGHRIAALQVTVAALGVGGLVAVFDLAKRVLSSPRALFVASLVAIGPLWASLSASYMTDVPAFALAMICLALGARAIGADDLRARVFVGSVLVGFLAFTIREYALIAPIAVCSTACWTASGWPVRRRAAVVIALATCLVSAAIFYCWRIGLPGFAAGNGLKTPTLATARYALHVSLQSAVLVGLGLAPAALLAGPKRMLQAAWERAPKTTIALGSLTMLGLGGEALRQRAHSGVFTALASLLGPGNYALSNGTLGFATLFGTRPDLFPKLVFAVLTLVGAGTILLLVLVGVPPALDAVDRIRREGLGTPASPALSVVTIGAIGFGLTCGPLAVVGLPVFDRYELPLIPLVGILALHAGGAGFVSITPWMLRRSGAAFLALAVLGLTYAANSASFDGTKWRVAAQAATVAGNPLRVNGGFEWTNYYAGKEIFFVERLRRAADFCIVLRAESARPHGQGAFGAPVWGPTGTQVWVVARQRHPC
jgi:hypothetical protein